MKKHLVAGAAMFCLSLSGGQALAQDDGDYPLNDSGQQETQPAAQQETQPAALMCGGIGITVAADPAANATASGGGESSVGSAGSADVLPGLSGDPATAGLADVSARPTMGAVASAVACANAPTTPGPLASTGSDNSELLRIGGITGVAGLGLVAMTRFRRRHGIAANA